MAFITGIVTTFLQKAVIDYMRDHPDEARVKPKLKIKRHFGALPLEEHICDLEEAREILGNYFPNERWAGALVGVDGELVRSYEELVEFAKRNKDKEFLEVGIYPQSGGG